VGIGFGLLLVASFAVRHFQSPPIPVARQFLTEQGVAENDNLKVAGLRDDGTMPMIPFGQTAKVEFRKTGGDPQKKLVVEVSRTAYFLPWHATGFHEEKD
jgi:hypothetical protein